MSALYYIPRVAVAQLSLPGRESDAGEGLETPEVDDGGQAYDWYAEEGGE